MYDPIMRVLTVLEILQARERVSGTELAERLEVNLRTVQRYIARLQDLTIPVEAVRGVGGYYRLKPGFRLPPLMFTDEEAFALMLGLRGLRHLGLSAFAPATEGAAAKLGRVLPDPLRHSLQTVEEVVALEPGPWVISTSAIDLILVSHAIRSRHSVCFDYANYQGVSSCREIEPYGVMHADGRWYMVGRCLLRKALRTFRLDRVTNLEAGEVSFERPKDFDTKTYLHQSMPFVQTAFALQIWIEMPIETASSHFALYRVSMEVSEGGTLLRCHRDQLEPFAAMLLSLGCRIVVHEPAAMKEAFANLARRAGLAAAECKH
ncbi:helix-turn-helix transcriptional regulator [Bryobacter aggregatus]|uniref:helix-turn-helix transcriptional regulator n=1 Tax=Bryobacter aggregatus TaxID=360054 RepID=UPI00056D368E|nr:YafY family protein [Bryobacter aggregatus]